MGGTHRQGRVERSRRRRCRGWLLAAAALAASLASTPAALGASRDPLAWSASLRAQTASPSPLPKVMKVTPRRGSAAGGTAVTIGGARFEEVSAVKFGSTNAAEFHVNPEGSIVTAVSPAGSTGVVDVTVTTPAGTSTTSHKDQFTFTPAVSGVSPGIGPTAGATKVTISGTGFALGAATLFRFGSKPATSVDCTSTTSCTALAPAHKAATVLVRASVNGIRGVAEPPGGQYTYVAPPTLTGVSPNEGPEAGATSVSISGTSFTAGSTVMFGAAAASSVTVNSSVSITALSPKGTGTVNVTVTTPGGTTEVVEADQFTYRPIPTVVGVTPKEGPETGGTSVTIAGTGFTASSTVKFGATAASSVKVNSDSSITASSPAGAGTVDVRVTTAGGTTATSAADKFTYVPPPSVSKLTPNTGPEAGGTSVIIEGNHLTGATAVKFGTTSATTFTVNSDTMITAVSPAGSGVVDVTVTTVGGTSATSEADRFSYIKVP